MIIPAQHIRALCDGSYGAKPMIEPFVERSVAFGMSYGLSIAGYDIRIKQDITLYPVNMVNLLLGRKSFSLASTIERFTIPNDVIGTVHDKSTWARQGLAAQATVIESGWCGYLTLELSNHGNKVIKIKAGMPIAQILFTRLESPAQSLYSGKYQNQIDDIVEAIFE